MERFYALVDFIYAKGGIAGVIIACFIFQNFIWPEIWRYLKIKLGKKWVSWEDINTKVDINVEDIKNLKTDFNGHLKVEETEEVRFMKLELEQKYAKERREEDIKLFEKFEANQTEAFHLIGEIKNRMIDRQ